VQETPVPANTPIIIKKPVIVAKYRHLLNSVKTKEEIPKIHIEEAKALLESGRAVLVDARGFNEYEISHIKNALSIPAGPSQKPQ